MLTELDWVTLKSGEKMRVCLLKPPADDLLDSLKVFFQHYPDQPRRDIFQRFRGDYAQTCDDFYFLGMVDDQIAGVVWYGYAKDSYGIANFGNVYTAPEHRKKSITKILMQYFAKSFEDSKARAAFCTCSNPWIVSIYTKHGFKPVLPGTEVGFLMLANKGNTDDFTKFTNNYYAIKSKMNLKVVPGNIKQRHPVDTVFHFYKHLRPELFKPRVALSSLIWNYQFALHCVEDKKGKLFTAVTDDGRVIGWAFCINTVFPLEQSTGILDYEIHPQYAEFAPTLIKKAVLGSKDSFKTINAQISSLDTDKISAFTTVGFKPSDKSYNCGRFKNFKLDG